MKNIKVSPAGRSFVDGKRCDVCDKIFNWDIPFSRFSIIEYDKFSSISNGALTFTIPVRGAKITHSDKCEILAILQVLDEAD